MRKSMILWKCLHFCEENAASQQDVGTVGLSYFSDIRVKPAAPGPKTPGGNPHCVVFVDNVDRIDIESVGPQFETAPIFPERVNTEFVRVVNSKTLKMRVWERGNGETQACGTGACAAVIAAVENGYCNKDEDITVKVKGGDLIVNYSDTGVTLTGDCNLVYKGEIEY